MARRRTRSRESSAVTKAEVIRLGVRAKRIVGGAAFLLTAIFGWLKLQDVPIAQALGTVEADIILRLALVIFYVSWIFGLLNDTTEQELVYAAVPGQGRVPPWAYGVAVAITGLFALLCFVETTEQFAVVLSVFLVVNIVAWRYHVKNIVRKSYSASKAHYVQTNDRASLLSLETVFAYHSGRWQWYRFAAGGILVAALLLTAFSDAGTRVSAFIYLLPNATIAALLVFLYVLTMEAWIWVVRIRVKVTLDTISRLAEQFRFEPIRDV